MPLLRTVRLFNAIESNGLTSATLETLLADAGRANDMAALAYSRPLMRRMAEVPNASAIALGSARGRAAIFASPVAMDAFLASKRGRAAMFDTPAVMTALAASSEGMATIGDSTICKMALSESNTALAAVLASPTALTALRAALQYSVVTVNAGGGGGTGEQPLTLPGSRYIALGASAGVNPLNFSVTLKTASASSGSNVISWTNATTATDDAMTKGGAIGIKAPYTYQLSSDKPTKVGLLRCDI